MTNIDRAKLTKFIIAQAVHCPNDYFTTEDALRVTCDEANDVELAELAEGWKDEINFQDAKEIEIDYYVRELELAQEQTVTMTRRDLIDLYYACAQAEMMWRTRSNNAVSYLTYDITPEDHEVECRAEMKKYRILQKQLGEKINY